MAIIVSSVAAGFLPATGRPGQGHLVYAQNLAQWWVFYLTGTQNLNAIVSSDFNTWAGPASGSPFTLTFAHRLEGRSYAFAYANLASTDVVHMVSSYLNGVITLPKTAETFHARFTLGSTWTNTNAEANTGNNASAYTTTLVPSGVATTLDSTGLPVDMSPYWLVVASGLSGDQQIARASNTDAGTSWTAGFGTPVQPNTGSGLTESNAIFPLASGNLLALSDNSSATGSMTNLLWSMWNGLTWSSSGNVLLGGPVTTTDVNAWGAVARTTTDVHMLILSDNVNHYGHQRFNGTSWSLGDTVPTLTYGTNSGIFMATDGTSVWAFVIDNMNTVQYTKWVSGTGWSAWADVITNASSAAWLSGCQQVVSSQIGLIWTLQDGSNYDIAGVLFPTVSTFPVGAISCSQP